MKELATLEPKQSSYERARDLAEKYGAIPYEHHYGGLDCLEGYFQDCTYRIPIPTGRYSKTLRYLPELLQVDMEPWSGAGFIRIKDGKVDSYTFFVLFRTAGGAQRGAGAEREGCHNDTAVQARVSETYVVRRNDVCAEGRGFALDACVAPSATSNERLRGWRFDFTCLARVGGCQEICEVMPKAWRDFYIHRGKDDAERYGEPYRFCKDVERYLEIGQ